jgi:hypothetical protein
MASHGHFWYWALRRQKFVEAVLVCMRSNLGTMEAEWISHPESERIDVF